MWSRIIHSQTFIAEGLISSGTPPCLIGGRNLESGQVVFPCPSDPERYEAIELPKRGVVWSWTVQRFRPKSPPYTGPEEFEPYAVAYVELPGVVIVEARLENVDFDKIAIGLEVEMILIPFAKDKEGNTVMTYGFSPVGERKNNE